MGLGVGTTNISINSDNIHLVFTNGIYESMMSWNMVLLLILFIITGLSIFTLLSSPARKITKTICLFSTLSIIILSFITLFPQSKFQEKLIITDNLLSIQYADGSIKNIKKSDVDLLSLSGTGATCTELKSIINSKEHGEVLLDIYIPTFSSLFCHIDPITEKVTPDLDINIMHHVDLNKADQVALIGENINNNTNYINNITLEFTCLFFIVFFLLLPMKEKNFRLRLTMVSIFAIPLFCLLFFSVLKNESHYTSFGDDGISAYFFHKPSIHIKKEDIKDLKIAYKAYNHFLMFLITDKNDQSYEFLINTEVDTKKYQNLFTD